MENLEQALYVIVPVVMIAAIILVIRNDIKESKEQSLDEIFKIENLYLTNRFGYYFVVLATDIKDMSSWFCVASDYLVNDSNEIKFVKFTAWDGFANKQKLRIDQCRYTDFDKAQEAYDIVAQAIKETNKNADNGKERQHED